MEGSHNQESEQPTREATASLSQTDILGEMPQIPLNIPLNLPEISSGPALSDLFTTQGVTPVSEKRASNVARLAEENAKLNAELRAMSERLEAAEKKRAEIERARIERVKRLAQKEQSIMEPPSS